MAVWGAVSETKGNILHKAQAPCSSLSIHSPVSVARGRGSRSFQPRPSVVPMKMALRAKYKEVCACFTCMQGETAPFYTVTMEFIIILMMLQLRRVSVG